MYVYFVGKLKFPKVFTDSDLKTCPDRYSMSDDVVNGKEALLDTTVRYEHVSDFCTIGITLLPPRTCMLPLHPTQFAWW